MRNEKLTQLSFDDYIRETVMEDRFVGAKHLMGAINSHAPSYEEDYWQTYLDEVDSRQGIFNQVDMGRVYDRQRGFNPPIR